MDGQRMLVVQPLTPELQTTGKRLICTRFAPAPGAGETDLLGARQGSQLSVSARRAARRYHHRGHRGFRPREAPNRATATAARQARKGQAMLIARVIGELVATQKHASHEGRKLLLVQPLNLDGSESRRRRGGAGRGGCRRGRPGAAGDRRLQRHDRRGPSAITDRYGGNWLYRSDRAPAGRRIRERRRPAPRSSHTGQQDPRFTSLPTRPPS